MTDLAVLVAFLPFLLFGERRSPQKAVANSSSSSKKEKKKSCNKEALIKRLRRIWPAQTNKQTG